MDEVQRLVGGSRLVTLTGSGGVGKTRLAQESVARLVDGYPGGVWLVELAPLADSQLVPQAVASALDVREAGPRPILETLIDTIRQRRLLLVLDNCEHLVEACAALASALLRSCPEVQILATSRQPLGLAGETVWQVPPLGLPPAAPNARGSPAPDSEAMRLFVERARTVQPTFTMTDRNASAIAGICGQLDGIPLAIELAAVWVKVLTVEEIAARLGDRFRFLTGGSQTAPPRQQTLERTLDWSYDLLGVAEQVFFRRLAVFEGGWTLDAAEAVCSDDPIGSNRVLALLTQLVDKSLVQAEAGHEPSRYRLLETTRHYAWARLVESGEVEAIRRRHAAYVLTVAREAEPGLLGPGQLAWLERLERERDNLRAALRWSVERGDTETELQLVASLWDFWWMRGYIKEGQAWLERALTREGGSPRARARAVHGAGLLATIRGDLNRGVAQFAESVAQFRELDEPGGAVRPLVDLGTSMWLLDDTPRAKAFLDEALRMAREVGDHWGTAYALYALGIYSYVHEQFDAAVAAGDEGVGVWRAVGDARGLAHTLWVLAAAVRGRGELDRAAALGRESLQLFQRLGETWGILNALMRLAASAALQERPARAARLLGAAEGLSDALGVPRNFPLWRLDLEHALAAGAAMEPVAFEAVLSAGRAMPLNDAVAFALSDDEVPASGMPAPQPLAPERGAPLSLREQEVAALIAHGATNRQIAESLAISELTADTHVRNIRRKLGARSRAQVASWAVRQGLVFSSNN
jgi:non-specific serine/threonine protein kinase